MYKEGTVEKLNGIDCYILLNEVIHDHHYLYTSEFEDDDITDRFNIYKEVEQDHYEILSDPEEIKKVLPVILKILNDKINE